MPGLIGFVKEFPETRAREFLTDMAHALEPDDRFQQDLYAGAGFGLGRISLGIADPQTQPVWNEDHTLCVLMEGELYDTANLKQQLRNRGYHPKNNTDAELVLHLYQEFGDDFAVKLNGAFVIAIWDEQAKKLRVANDRLGLYPLYYAHTHQSLIFGSGVRALLVDTELDRSTDRVAVNEFLVFDHVLHDRTLLKQVRLLPQASLLSFDGQHLDIRPYWNLTYPELYEKRSEQALIEQLTHYLRQAITRQAPGDTPAGLLLSGGLDSRVLLALLRDGPVDETFHTFTWGIPDCDDARFAREMARRAGTQHHFFELKPDWLLDLAEEGVRLTDGLGNVINLHALATLEQEANYAQILYKGFMGDAMLGFALKRQFWADYPADTATDIHLQVHQSQGVINYSPEEQKQLFTDSFQQTVGNAIYDDYRAGMQKSGVRQLGNQRLYFDLTQRVPRMTLNGVEVARSRAMVRLPFCDNDLLDFILTVPPGFLFERHLMTEAFIRTYPKLAQIPMAGSGLPMIACARDIRLRAQKLIRWHLRKRGLGRLAGPERRPYKDYNTWFRTVLRHWVEDTLLSRRALERGYFKPEAVRQLVADHMAGADHTVRLGALLALELWHQQFLD